MSLALFDLDNTLIDGDSDYLWGRFLVEKGIVDGEYYERENQRFFDQYLAGTLDIGAYCRFAFKPLAETPLIELQRLRSKFIEQHVKPLILPKAIDLLSQHRQQGDILIIITSTNRFVTEPISKELGIDTLMATEPEFKNGRYTGNLHGIPCFQQGKVMCLQEWMKETGHSLEGSWFYSDSHNDLPLLEIVTHPVAVDADPQLSQHAKQKGWPIISLKTY
jgi:HAD superfamily hydrolase (TIGR01490 family)